MLILHVTPSYKPGYIYGGTIVSIANLCESTAKMGVAVKVLTTTANGREELEVDVCKSTFLSGVEVLYSKRVTQDHSHFSPQLLLRLVRLLRKNTKVVLHVHSWWNWTAVLSCLIGVLFSKPVLISPRGMLTAYTFNNKSRPSKRLFHFLLGRKLLKHCCLHATSRQEESDIRKLVSSSHIRLIPNLPDESLLHLGLRQTRLPALKMENSQVPINFLYLSRIDKKKGLEILLEALATVSFPWKLNIAGNGSDSYIKTLKSLLTTLNIERSVNWLGYISPNQKSKVLQENDLLVLPSYNENFANVVLESLSLGTAVLVSKYVGLADFVIIHDLGWICDTTVESLTATICSANAEKSKRDRIKFTAPALIQENFNKKVLIEKYIDLYDDLINPTTNA